MRISQIFLLICILPNLLSNPLTSKINRNFLKNDNNRYDWDSLSISDWENNSGASHKRHDSDLLDSVLNSHANDKYSKEINGKEYQLHGTTTVALKCPSDNCILVAVDSRASVGEYVGSRTVKKVIPIDTHTIATIAGGAADCFHWIRYISYRKAILQRQNQQELSVYNIAKLFSSMMKEKKHLGISIGSMIAGVKLSKYNNNNNNNNNNNVHTKKGHHNHEDFNQDLDLSLYYIDNDGNCLEGNSFCVGSGAFFAYAIIDSFYHKEIKFQDAKRVAMHAIRYAAHRDGYSGGYINVFCLNSTGIHHIERYDSRNLPLLTETPRRK